MKSISDLDLKNKKVLIRVDFNVPLKNGVVTDDTRIRAAIPTINFVLENSASVILMSHLGRPKNGFEGVFSLRHIVPTLSKHLNRNVAFIDDCIGDKVTEAVSNLKAGGILLLENLRFYKEETKGDEEFAKKLAAHADIYVNDAFGTAHRAHASTSIIANFVNEKACGFLMQKEILNADKVLKDAKKPFIAIVGGAKVSDKITIIEQLLDKADTILIGGGMAYTFLKALGGEIGRSIVEEEKVSLAKDTLDKAKSKGVNIILPVDSVVADKFDNEATIKVEPSDKIDENYMGLDIGSKARAKFHEAIINAKTIIWNGPMGVFEMSNFANGTLAIAKSIAQATEKGAYSLIGGGDSAAAVNSLGFGDKVSYVSTGGGALLEYLEGKELPGVKALG